MRISGRLLPRPRRCPVSAAAAVPPPRRGPAAAMKDVPGFLQQSQSSGPGQAAVWHRLEELYTKK